MKGVGSNKTAKAIVRCRKALGPLREILECFDKDNAVPAPSGSHGCPSYTEDIKLIVDKLQKGHIFDKMVNRKHHFNKPKNLLHAKPTNDVISRVDTHINQKYLK